MKKIFSIIMLCALSLAAVAQTTLTKPQAMKILMGKERLSNTLQSLQKPARQQSKLVAETPATWAATTYNVAKAPAELTDLDTTEVYFNSFYEDPYFYPADTVVGRRGDTVITEAEWLFVLENERYQFNFDIIKGANPNSLAGNYTEENLDEWGSWCMFPEAEGDSHYYKTCKLTIQEEKISNNLIRYTVDALILATCGIGGEEYGYFKLHAEHKIINANTKLDVALYNCSIESEEDRFRIAGKDSEIEVDFTFFTMTGIEGYYSHKLMDEENSKIVHEGKEKGVMDLEGVVYSAENIYGGLTYVFMCEAFTTDTCFYNIAMEAPVQAKDTIEITAKNAIVNDAYGMTDQTILVDASTPEYEINAAYNATMITTPAEYPTGSSYVYLTDNKTGERITSIICNLKITGNKLQGFQVEIRMLGTDYNYYIMHLSYREPEKKETKVLDFKNNSKAMYYIDHLGLRELQMANYDGEYSVSFDILYIDQVMGGEFDLTNTFADHTFFINHVEEDGVIVDLPVPFAEFGGKIWQEKDTTYLTASILGFDSIQYEISMFYTVPTPTKKVTYTFDGLGDDEVIFLNAVVTSGIFTLEAKSADANLRAMVNVERIETKSVEGTFYNDGKFDHTDFYPVETYVEVWNEETEKFDNFAVIKGSMTVTVENKILTAVASFICDNAVQYDLTFKVPYVREYVSFDEMEDAFDYTFEEDAIVVVRDWIEDYGGIIELFLLSADLSLESNFYFYVEKTSSLDPEIGIPAGVYPIKASRAVGTVLACEGHLPDGPAPSYICALDAEGYYDPLSLFYAFVDGTVTIKNVNGKLSVEVDAVNSYDVPVKIHYNPAPTAVEDITAGNTNISKRLINGQLLIIRNGETYNANGALVK